MMTECINRKKQGEKQESMYSMGIQHGNTYENILLAAELKIAE
jgi:hypothetical protein